MRTLRFLRLFSRTILMPIIVAFALMVAKPGLVSATEGHALIIQGGYGTDSEWALRYAESVRRIRRYCEAIGITRNDGDDASNALWVLSPDASLARPVAAASGFNGDGTPTASNIRGYLRDVIAPAMAEFPVPLYVIFVGPALPGVFYLGDGGDITAPTLESIVEEFQEETIKGNAGDVFKVLLMGSNYAETLLPDPLEESNRTRMS